MQPACLTPQSSIVQMTLRVLRLMMSTSQQRYVLYHKYYSLTNALVLFMCTYAHDPPIQGIVGLAAYAYLLRAHGQTAEADHYDSLNKDFVQVWLTNASVGHSTTINTMIVTSPFTFKDGDHYKRQYNTTNSWSLKYNLVFQVELHYMSKCSHNYACLCACGEARFSSSSFRKHWSLLYFLTVPSLLRRTTTRK